MALILRSNLGGAWTSTLHSSCWAQSEYGPEPGPGHHHGEEQQDGIEADHRQLPAAPVDDGGADHQHRQSDRGQRHQHGRRAGHRRQQQPDARQHLQRADRADAAVGELLHPPHAGGQLLARLADLGHPSQQERQGQQHLQDPDHHVHDGCFRPLAHVGPRGARARTTAASTLHEGQGGLELGSGRAGGGARTFHGKGGGDVGDPGCPERVVADGEEGQEGRDMGVAGAGGVDHPRRPARDVQRQATWRRSAKVASSGSHTAGR